MRVLLVNGNRTQAVTDHCLRVARSVAGPDVTFEGVTARFGADIVTAEPENVIAAHAVLDLLAEHHARFDAAILAISFDSGLFAARDLVPIPVIGMTEAALQAAAADGAPVGVVLFGEASLPLYEAHFARLPEGQPIRAIRVVKITSVATYLDADAQARAVLAEIAALEGEGIRHIVICGAAMAGLAARLAPMCSARLFDGIIEAVATVQRLPQASRPAPRNPLARSSTVIGLSPALQALFEARNAGQ
jgi:allantoin racemase